MNHINLLFKTLHLSAALFILAACNPGDDERINPQSSSREIVIFQNDNSYTPVTKSVFVKTANHPKSETPISDKPIKTKMSRTKAATSKQPVYRTKSLTVAPPVFEACSGLEVTRCEIDNLFRSILNRKPSAEETEVFVALIQQSGFKEAARRIAFSEEAAVNIASLIVQYLQPKAGLVDPKEVVEKQNELASGKSLYGLTLDFKKKARRH
jgi:hypothetical protein